MAKQLRLKKAPANPLLYASEDYYVEALDSGSLTPEEMRAEFSRLRKLANKRLTGIKNAGYDNTGVYQEYAKSFPTLIEFDKMPAHFQNVELSRLARFFQMKTSSATGIYNQRAATVNAMQRKGHNYINMGNVDQFGQFMAEVRAHHKELLYPSDRALAVFKAAIADKNVPIEQTKKAFESYLSKEDTTTRKQSRSANGSKSTRKRMK